MVTDPVASGTAFGVPLPRLETPQSSRDGWLRTLLATGGSELFFATGGSELFFATGGSEPFFATAGSEPKTVVGIQTTVFVREPAFEW